MSHGSRRNLYHATDYVLTSGVPCSLARCHHLMCCFKGSGNSLKNRHQGIVDDSRQGIRNVETCHISILLKPIGSILYLPCIHSYPLIPQIPYVRNRRRLLQLIPNLQLLISSLSIHHTYPTCLHSCMSRHL